MKGTFSADENEGAFHGHSRIYVWYSARQDQHPLTAWAIKAALLSGTENKVQSTLTPLPQILNSLPVRIEIAGVALTVPEV